MNCEEVTELMQRDLDLDLSEEEHRQLLEHLPRCPECAALYDRLKRLSDELEKLPPVHPPYSLVDAILPQLAEMENGAHEHSAAVEKPVSPARRTRSGFGIWPLVGGGVAAAVVAGLLVTNMPWQGGSRADKAASLPQSAGTALQNDQKAGQNEESGPLSKRTADSTPPSMPSTAPTPETSSGEAVGGTDAPASSGGNDLKIAENESLIAQAEKNKSLATQAPEEDKAPPKRSAEKSAPPNTFGAVDSSNAASSAFSSSPNSSEGGGGMVPGQIVAPGKAKADNVVTFDPGAGAAGITSNQDKQSALAPPQGATASGSPHQLATDNGKYTAYYENNRVTVRTSAGATAFTSGQTWKAGDSVRLLSWSNDTQLYYEVTDAGGAVRQFMIDLALNREVQK